MTDVHCHRGVLVWPWVSFWFFLVMRYQRTGTSNFFKGYDNTQREGLLNTCLITLTLNNREETLMWSSVSQRCFCSKTPNFCQVLFHIFIFTNVLSNLKIKHDVNEIAEKQKEKPWLFSLFPPWFILQKNVYDVIKEFLSWLLVNSCFPKTFRVLLHNYEAEMPNVCLKGKYSWQSFVTRGMSFWKDWRKIICYFPLFVKK